jgi:hypothetical protein
MIAIRPPISSKNEVSSGALDRTKSSHLSSGGPFEMKHFDKIPRTPIDPDLLAQIHRDNVSQQ